MATVENKPVELTQDHVQKIFKCTASKAATYYPHFKKYCGEKQINTVLRLAAFLAQVGHESGNLQYTEENLNYSASGLLKTFPKYFDSSNAQAYAKNPQKIASRTYANRMGNSNEASGEGWAYRGRGLIQLTGKQGYQRCNKSVPCLSNPDFLKTPEGAVASAVWYWDNHQLNSYADRNAFDRTTFIINGGNNGAADRRAKYEWAIKVLTGDPTATTTDVQPSRTDDLENEPTQTAERGSFSEPSLDRSPVYPWNQVNETRSGHLIEVDDSPGAERLYVGHRTGSYAAINPLGNVTLKSALDRFDITKEDLYVYVGATLTQKVEGQAYHKFGSEVVWSASGNMFFETNRVQFNAGMVVCRDSLLARDGQFKSLMSEEVAQLTARDAQYAEVAGRLGGSGGEKLASLSESLDLSPSGAPSFNKPVEMTQPTKMKAIDVGSARAAMPPASSFPDSIHMLKNGDARILVYSDGKDWRKVKDDSIYSGA